MAMIDAATQAAKDARETEKETGRGKVHGRLVSLYVLCAWGDLTGNHLAAQTRSVHMASHGRVAVRAIEGKTRMYAPAAMSHTPCHFADVRKTPDMASWNTMLAM
jgi:hypothetical protein